MDRSQKKHRQRHVGRDRQWRVQPSTLSYAFAGSFLVCAFLLRWTAPPFPPVVFAAVALPAIILILTLWLAPALRPVLAPLASCLCGTILALAVVSYHAHIPSPLNIESFANATSVTIHGFITEDPDRRPMLAKYTVEADRIKPKDGDWQPAHGRVLVTDRNGWPEHRYLSEVEATGKLERPGKIEDFSYDNYLQIQDIYAVITRANVKGLQETYPSGLLGWRRMYAGLIRLREIFELQIQRVYPEPHAAFLAGLLTGSRSGIPENLTEEFRISGLSHIIAISGYNITIIITLMSGMLFFIPLRWRFPLLVVAITSFTLLVGASASVVRAAVMGILGLFAIQLGRQAEIRLTILWTALMMTAWNPTLLWFDAGFQLSFLAVIGLSELSEPMDRLLKHVPDTFAIRTSLAATLAAQVFTLPLIILLFKRVSLIAPFANLLVAPLIPLAMLFGFAGTVMSFLWFPAGQLVAYVGWGLLELIIWIAHLCAMVPWASVGI